MTSSLESLRSSSYREKTGDPLSFDISNVVGLFKLVPFANEIVVVCWHVVFVSLAPLLRWLLASLHQLTLGQRSQSM